MGKRERTKRHENTVDVKPEERYENTVGIMPEGYPGAARNMEARLSKGNEEQL